MSMKKDLTGESIHLVNDETPEEDKIPEDMIEDAPEYTESMVTSEEEIHGKPDVVRVKQLHIFDDVDVATIPQGFMDHGFMHDPSCPGRFPSSRDWNIPDIKCGQESCATNYNGKCVMPSLIEIGVTGKCKGYHERGSGKKK